MGRPPSVTAAWPRDVAEVGLHPSACPERFSSEGNPVLDGNDQRSVRCSQTPSPTSPHPRTQSLGFRGASG